MATKGVAAMKCKLYQHNSSVIDLLKKFCLVKRDFLPMSMNNHII